MLFLFDTLCIFSSLIDIIYTMCLFKNLGMMIIARHRMVNKLLSEELDGKIHALSIQAKTVSQWQSDPSFHDTPDCQGGSKR